MPDRKIIQGVSLLGAEYFKHRAIEDNDHMPRTLSGSARSLRTLQGRVTVRKDVLSKIVGRHVVLYSDLVEGKQASFQTSGILVFTIGRGQIAMIQVRNLLD